MPSIPRWWTSVAMTLAALMITSVLPGGSQSAPAPASQYPPSAYTLFCVEMWTDPLVSTPEELQAETCEVDFLACIGGYYDSRVKSCPSGTGMCYCYRAQLPIEETLEPAECNGIYEECMDRVLPGPIPPAQPMQPAQP